MNPKLGQIVNAVLYEGYILYPYRALSQKNQRERFTFGRVYPKIYSENQNGAKPCALEKVVPKLPEIGEPKFQNVPRLPRTSRPRKWTRSWRFCKRENSMAVTTAGFAFEMRHPKFTVGFHPIGLARRIT